MRPVGEPFEKIQADCKLILRRLYVPTAPPLFHYTTAEGLHGILRSGELRASNYAFMNDRSEFTYGANLLRALVEERASAPRGETDQDYYEAILRSRNPIASDLYIVCFCAERDLLSQWRGYGGAGSRYCIQFDPNRLTRLHEASPLLPVLYDKAKQRQLLDDLLDAHLNGVVGHVGYNPAFYDSLASCTYACCITAFALFRDWAFHEEQEWRYVLLVRPGTLVNQLEFWSSSGVMKPMLGLVRGKGGRLPVTEIVCGASAAPDQALRSAQLLAARFGYLDVPVVPSSVPLVG